MLTHHNFPRTDSYVLLRFFFALALFVRTFAATFDALVANRSQSKVCERSKWRGALICSPAAVNCIGPGMIDLGEKAAAGFMRRMAKQTPMKLNGTGDEIAAAVLFFATANVSYGADSRSGWRPCALTHSQD